MANRSTVNLLLCCVVLCCAVVVCCSFSSLALGVDVGGPDPTMVQISNGLGQSVSFPFTYPELKIQDIISSAGGIPAGGMTEISIFTTQDLFRNVRSPTVVYRHPLILTSRSNSGRSHRLLLRERLCLPSSENGSH